MEPKSYECAPTQNGQIYLKQKSFFSNFLFCNLNKQFLSMNFVDVKKSKGWKSKVGKDRTLRVLRPCALLGIVLAENGAGMGKKPVPGFQL